MIGPWTLEPRGGPPGKPSPLRHTDISTFDIRYCHFARLEDTYVLTHRRYENG